MMHPSTLTERPGFTAKYRTIFATARNTRKGDESKPLVPNGVFHSVYYQNISGAVAASVEGLIFWFLFIKEDTPSRTPNCPRYTDPDAQTTINQYGHLKLSPDYTFGDLWDLTNRSAMVPLEEGVIEGAWNNGGRVLLLGDAAAKVFVLMSEESLEDITLTTEQSTVNAGIGGNTCVEGVVRFVNELLPLLKGSRDVAPTTKEVHVMFEAFEAKQRPRTQLTVSLSSIYTRYEAMDTWWLRSIRLMYPWLRDQWKARVLLWFMKPAPVLDFLPVPGAEGV